MLDILYKGLSKSSGKSLGGLHRDVSKSSGKSLGLLHKSVSKSSGKRKYWSKGAVRLTS